jgi:hypothetical protein
MPTTVQVRQQAVARRGIGILISVAVCAVAFVVRPVAVRPKLALTYQSA